MNPKKTFLMLVGNNPGISSKELGEALNMVYAEIWTLGAELQKKGYVEFRSLKGRWKQMRWFSTNKDLLS